ncbi:unknown [Acidiphilium sp. CAG:727]|nr:unknown [Acidiphilium sp. CAG:727]
MNLRQSERHALPFNCNALQTALSSPLACRASGVSYKQSIVTSETTFSGGTLQNRAIFALMSSPTSPSERTTITSGCMPIPLNSATLCCVGFDLYSSEPEM